MVGKHTGGKKGPHGIRRRMPLRRDPTTRYDDPITGKVAKGTGKVIMTKLGMPVGGNELTGPQRKERMFFRPARQYSTGQDYNTFAVDYNGEFENQVRWLRSKLPLNTLGDFRAMEIGAANQPMISRLNCGEHIFCDISAACLDSARVSHALINPSSKNARFVNGDLRKGFSQFTNGEFGVIVVNEILTHIVPEQRNAAIDELARLGQRIFLIDRFTTSRKSLPLALKGDSEEMFKYRQYLSPSKIANRLVKKGYEVEIYLYPTSASSTNKNFRVGYFRLFAKKSERPRLKSVKVKNLGQSIWQMLVSGITGMISTGQSEETQIYPKPKKQSD